MPDKIELNEDLGIIEVVSFGKVSSNDIEQSIVKVRHIFMETGIRKILVDTRTQETMPDTLKIYKIFSTFPQQFKLALLANHFQTTAKDITFAETVSVNRAVRVKIFYEKELAVQWLNH